MKTTGITDMRAAVLSWALKISEENAANALTWVDAVSSSAEWMVKAESPLERLFLAAMSMHGGFWCGDPKMGDGDLISFCDWAATLQYEVDGMRVDIRLEHPFDWVVYVELDGHDFHERTKEQAARDRSRDRLLTGPRSSVLRFTGSEVYADPVKCVNELASKLDDIKDGLARRHRESVERNSELCHSSSSDDLCKMADIYRAMGMEETAKLFENFAKPRSLPTEQT